MIAQQRYLLRIRTGAPADVRLVELDTELARDVRGEVADGVVYLRRKSLAAVIWRRATEDARPDVVIMPRRLVHKRVARRAHSDMRARVPELPPPAPPP